MRRALMVLSVVLFAVPAMAQTYPARSEQELRAEGYTPHYEANGAIVWTRPTTMMSCGGGGCSSGSCGTSMQMGGGCASGSCGGMSHQMAGGCSSGSCGGGAMQRPMQRGMLRPRVPMAAEWPAAPRGTSPPVETPPQKPAPPAPTIDTKKIADAVIESMANDPRFRGPPGPTGKDGIDGKDATVNIDELADKVTARIKPIHVRVLGKDGTVVKEFTVAQGGNLDLEPVYFEQYDVDGSRVDGDTIPLGGTLRIQEKLTIVNAK